MSRAFDDYYIEDCGIILASEVTQRRIDNSDQLVILATVRHMWNVLSNDETIQIVSYIEVCMILMVAM
ncbi:putative protein phosphatase 2C 33 [Zea mays]|uniref:protein-serine/threonine phosphatase n=1 Tax=Zea mays TaxID=4577 RepID=A0A1D6KTI6_MAIZE|nr:putative protein phosphatase 2C 33 [Zea mays]